MNTKTKSIEMNEEFKKANGIDGAYFIDEEGLCNVWGKVDLRSLGLTEIPIPFGRVTGDFRCSENKLTTLKNSPIEVGYDFSCSDNQLTSLECAPIYVGGSFSCEKNQLTSLEYAPKKVNIMFFCRNNAVRFKEEEVRAVCVVGSRVIDF